MTSSLTFPFAPVFFHLFRSCSNRVQATFRRLICPHSDSLVRGLLADLPRRNTELIAENALLRHQLLTLRVQRQVTRPRLRRHDRLRLLVLASRIAHWKQALVIIQPDTLLRWHREGFRLFWRHKSRPTTTKPKMEKETIELIQRMAQENLLGGGGTDPG